MEVKKATEGETTEVGETSTFSQARGYQGLSISDLVLRILAIGGTLGSAISMGTTNETLPFITQFMQFKAQYNDLPTFTFFVIANAVVCGYLVLSLPLSTFLIVRSRSRITRFILVVFDTVMLALISSGASSAATIVYLAHKGNASANWLAICQQFNSFCDRITWSLVGSFVAALMFILLVLLSTIALARR